MQIFLSVTHFENIGAKLIPAKLALQIDASKHNLIHAANEAAKELVHAALVFYDHSGQKSGSPPVLPGVSHVLLMPCDIQT